MKIVNPYVFCKSHRETSSHLFTVSFFYYSMGTYFEMVGGRMSHTLAVLRLSWFILEGRLIGSKEVGGY